jgi:hypothetical protein
MASSNPSSNSAFQLPALSNEDLSQLPEDSTIWANLKQAIAASSGFNRWQLERSADKRVTGLNLDHLVRLYLRETLETLAY